MKIRMLVIYVVGLSLIGSTWADGLPRMGYASGRSVKDLYQRVTAGSLLMDPTLAPRSRRSAKLPAAAPT
jgi:hypothetical protein